MHITYSLYFVVCLALFGVGSTDIVIPWSQLTAAQLSHLPPDVFPYMSPADIVLISPEVLSAINSQQLSSMTNAINNISAAQIAQISPEACVGLTQEQFGAISTEAISAFNAIQIANLPPSAFGSLTPDQMAAFTPNACNGFYNNLFGQMSFEATGGLTAECISNFNTTDPNTSPCAGLNQFQTPYIPPEAISGITPACMQILNNGQAMAGLTPAQASNFTLPVCAVLYWVKSTAVSGLTPQCLEQFSLSACQRVGYDIWIANLTPETISVLSAECIAQMDAPGAFSQLSPEQVEAMPAAAFAGFTNQLATFPNETLDAVSVEQLLALSNITGGLTSDQLVYLVNKFGSSLVNQWTAASTSAYSPVSLYEFKAMIQNVTIRITWSYLSSHLSSANWLHLALLETVPGSNFNEDFFQQLSPSALMGLRSDQVTLISTTNPSVFKYLSVQQLQYLVKDTALAMTTAQWTAIPGYLFGNVNTEAILGFNATSVPSMTQTQAYYLNYLQIQVMNCTQLQAITSTQLSVFQIDVQVWYQELASEDCSFTGPPFTSQPFAIPPVTAPISPPVTPPVAPPVKPPVNPPVQAPVSPPVQPPVKAPISPPVQAPVNPPVATPVSPPVQAPVTPPVRQPVAVPVANTPVNAPVQSPVTVPVMSPVNSPSHNVTLTPGTQSNDGLSQNYIIAIGCGAGAVLLAIIIGIVVWRRKRSMDPERQGLLVNEGPKGRA